MSLLKSTSIAATTWQVSGSGPNGPGTSLKTFAIAKVKSSVLQRFAPARQLTTTVRLNGSEASKHALHPSPFSSARLVATIAGVAMTSSCGTPARR